MKLRVVPAALLPALCFAAQPWFGYLPNHGQLPAEVRFFRPGGASLQVIGDGLRLLDFYDLKMQGLPTQEPAGASPLAARYHLYHGADRAQWREGQTAFSLVRFSGPDAVAPVQLELAQLPLNMAPGIPADAWSAVLPPATPLSQFRIAVSRLDGTRPQISAPLGTVVLHSPDGHRTATLNALVAQSTAEGRQERSAELTVEDGSLLGVRAEGLDPKLATEVRLLIWSDAEPPRQAPFSTAVAPWPGAGGAADAVLARWSPAGELLWLALVGGAGDEAPLKIVDAGSNLIVAARVSSTDAPVTVAGSARGAGDPDLLLLRFDADTGHLTQSAYTGLAAAVTFASPVLLTADPGGTVSGSAGQFAGERLWGRVWRWNPETGRFLFQTDIELPAEKLFTSTDLRLHALWRGWEGSLHAASLSPTGESTGPGVIVAAPGLRWSGLGPLLEDGGGALFAGALAPESELDSTRQAAYLLWLNPTTGATRPALRLAEATGFPYLARTRAGNLKYLLNGPGRHEPASDGALYRQPCDSLLAPGPSWGPSGYFGILTPQGQDVYATYVLSSEFDPATEDEPGNPPARPHACAADSLAAPGAWITIHGGGFGPATDLDLGPGVDGRFPTEAETLRLRVDGLDMPLYRVGPGRLEGQIPFEIEPSNESRQIEVSVNGQTLPAIPVKILAAAPHALPSGQWDAVSGKDILVAWNEDGTRNSAANPARAGQLVAILGTGLGALDPPLRTGELAPGAAGEPLSASGIRLQVEGASELVFLGSAAGLPTSVWQAVIRLPATLEQAGLHPVRLYSSQLCGVGRVCETVLADGLIHVQ